MIEEELDGKRRYIVSFKNKQEREDKETDKSEILQQSVGPRLNFVDVGSKTAGFAPPHDPDGLVALDINDFELPMLFVALSEKEAKTVNEDPNVAFVEPDGKFYAQGLSPYWLPSKGNFIEGDTLLPNSQATVSKGALIQAATIPWGVSNVKAPICWEATLGKGIYVAVLDTGIWPHDDLKENLVGGISFVPGESWVDHNGHGTHVAGTIAAKLNSSGVAGVAPSAYLYGIKVLSNDGSGNWSWLMSGLHWMKRYSDCRFDVANMSIGGSEVPSTLETFINDASRQTLLVAAGGNYPQSAPNKPVMYPAKYERCLAVSAIQSDNNIASFSARGPEIELCAPGVDIFSTMPDNTYNSMSGTSMAAPHVAGAAALCKGTHRSLNADEIRKILIDTANNLGIPGKDDEYGYGKVDCNGATFHKKCG